MKCLDFLRCVFANSKLIYRLDHFIGCGEAAGVRAADVLLLQIFESENDKARKRNDGACLIELRNRERILAFSSWLQSALADFREVSKCNSQPWHPCNG